MLTEEHTAGGIKTTEAVKKALAAKSLDFNFKKTYGKFEKMFGAYFDKVGIDPNTKKAL